MLRPLEKSFTSFKLCVGTPNKMQQGVQTDATCNIQQYLVVVGQQRLAHLHGT